MKKRGNIKENYVIKYLILYLIGTIITTISYIKNIEGMFLLGLLLITSSIFLYFLYISTNRKTKNKVKFTSPRFKKFNFPKFKVPKIRLPKFSFPKFLSINFNSILQKIKTKNDSKPEINKIRKFKVVSNKSEKITETDFDKLVKIVDQVDSVKLSTIAKLFNIDIKKAEEWGKILDDHNLIHLHYHGFGEPELRKWKKQ